MDEYRESPILQGFCRALKSAVERLIAQLGQQPTADEGAHDSATDVRDEAAAGASHYLAVLRASYLVVVLVDANRFLRHFDWRAIRRHGAPLSHTPVEPPFRTRGAAASRRGASSA